LTCLSISYGIAGADPLIDAIRGAKGEFNRKTWDQSVSQILANEDEALLGALLDARVKNGNAASERRFSLFAIYRKKPTFYVTSAKKHWKGSLDCVVETIVPLSGIIRPSEVEEIANSTLKSNPSPELAAFRARVVEYGKKTGKGADELDLEKCASPKKKN